MRIPLLLLLSVCVLEVVFAQNNKKKFGNGKSNPDYDPPAEDYEGDALYYEDYDENGAKKSKDAAAIAKDDKLNASNKEKTDKPVLARTTPSKDVADKDHKDAHPSLFAPRRNRTPFVPRPASRPKPTLPSFIRKPVDPGSITTPRTPPSRIATFSATTAKTSAVIRATTSRPSRFNNGGGAEKKRDRTTSAPSTVDDRNRRFGSSASRLNNKPARGNFRNPGN